MIKIICPCGFSLEAEDVGTDLIEKLWAEHKHPAPPIKYGSPEWRIELRQVLEELKRGEGEKGGVLT